MNESTNYRDTRGLTLVELLIVIAVIGILVSVIISQVWRAREQAFVARAEVQARSFANAVEQYRNANQFFYPTEEVGFNIPTVLHQYLDPALWEAGPWPASRYQWEYYTTAEGDDVAQLSVRFCPEGAVDVADCNFPPSSWASGFSLNSAYFYCLSGPCRSHRSESRNYPGYCMNCDCKEMATCH